MGNSSGGQRGQSRNSHFDHGYRNGQYLMRLPVHGFSPLPHKPVCEHLKATTIQNHVNVKKASLRLEEDTENPGFYLVAFSFDATLPGSICIFFLAKEGPGCSLTPQKPSIYKPRRVAFDKGLGQNFRQTSGTGVKLSLFQPEDLVREGQDDDVYSLVIRLDAVPKRMSTDSLADSALGPQPEWVQSQTTHAVIDKKDGGQYQVRALKQRIVVEGVRYDLQEIFDMGNAGDQFGLTGKECVICLSDPRDTALLPCRHMCMCSECAKVLRLQSSRCPICRSPVQKLLEIRVPKAEDG